MLAAEGLLRTTGEHAAMLIDGNGSAADLAAVVDFYDGRFAMGLSAPDKADLVAFLRTL